MKTFYRNSNDSIIAVADENNLIETPESFYKTRISWYNILNKIEYTLPYHMFKRSFKPVSLIEHFELMKKYGKLL